jgi:glycerophosphoryl diester phosphodiesterase
MKFNPFKNKFLFFGHRGTPDFAPENTIYSFKKAIEMGVDGIEFDVLLTQDDYPVIHHDIDLLNLTGENTKINSLNYSELKKIDVSGKWKNSIGYQSMPLLDEISKLLINNKIILNIEIKSVGFFSTKKIVKKVIHFISSNQLYKRCIVSSFNPLIIRKIKKLSPEIFTSLIWSKDETPIILKWYKPLCYIAKPNGFHPDKLFTNKKLVKWAKSKNLLICVFTVNDKIELNRLKKLGVNGVFTDNPKIME